MAVEATERWSPRRYERGPEYSSTATREFDIINSTTDAEAYAADLVSTDLANPTGKVPVFNEQHPANSIMRASRLSLSEPGYNLRRLTVVYTMNDGGGDHEDNDDPLARPLRLRWRRQIQVEPIDTDINGNPQVNSAYDAFSQPDQKDVTSRILEVTRFEPFYDATKAELYENTTNSVTWTIGPYSIGPGQAKLNIYQPLSDYSLEDTVIEVSYEFELRPDGFKARRLDEGYNAWTSGGQQLPIYTLDNQRLSQPTRLAGNGTTYSNYFRVGTSGATQAAAPSGLPPGATFENTGQAIFLNYTRYKSLNFSGLGLV